MPSSKALFRYEDEILRRFPNVRGGVVSARGVRNGESPVELRDLFLREQRKVFDRLRGGALTDLPSISAWRSAFHSFGVKPTQYRSAAEALLRRLTKHGEIPSLNCLVDLGNLVSIRYALPVAILDVQSIAGTLAVRFADGTEQFRELGSEDVKHPEPGEVIFVDESGMVSARRWCWRQSAESGAGESTTDVLITVEAHHPGGETDVKGAIADVQELLKEFCGGAQSASVLSPACPEFAAP